MNAPLPTLAAGVGLAACLASSIGCYPAYSSGYPSTAYSQGAKGYEVPYGPAPQETTQYGVDPGVVIAGAAAVGLLGYAIGSHHHHDYYGGYGYYRAVPYHYGHGYHHGYGRGYHRPHW